MGIYDLLSQLLPDAMDDGMSPQRPLGQQSGAEAGPPVPMPQPRPYVGNGQGASGYLNELGSTLGADAAPPAGAPQPQPQQANPQLMGPGEPVPMPRPSPMNQPPHPQANLPPNSAPAAGPPLSLAPPNPGAPPQPPMPAAQRPQQPGYQTAYEPRKGFMGMSPEQASRLGAGLTAVGNNWNKPGLAALAGTAGASIQAGEKTGEAQKAEDLKANAQHFNQTSTSFRNMMLARQNQNQEAYRQAQAKYLSARADAIAANGGGKVMSPEQKVTNVENQALRFRDQLRKETEAQARSAQAAGQPFDLAKAQAAIDTRYQAKRQELLQYYKITPQEADKAATQGMSKENPFDATRMTAQEFHTLVPMNAWFKNKDGRVMQRVKPPPGHDESSMAPNTDDMVAMQGIPDTPIPTGPTA